MIAALFISAALGTTQVVTKAEFEEKVVLPESSLTAEKAANRQEPPSENTGQLEVLKKENEKYGHVRKGTFKENFTRLAREYGFNFVAWDPRVANCQWEQKTEYKIPKDEAKQVLAYYAKTLDFYLEFSSVDNHVKVMYSGPMQRLSYCE